MDNMQIKRLPVLNIVDGDKTVVNALFLSKKSTRQVCEAVLLEWVTTYVKYLGDVVLDRHHQFQSSEFASL